jgi:hypothetical protein
MMRTAQEVLVLFFKKERLLDRCFFRVVNQARRGSVQAADS